jgi:hypothetical protein
MDSGPLRQLDRRRPRLGADGAGAFSTVCSISTGGAHRPRGRGRRPTCSTISTQPVGRREPQRDVFVPHPPPGPVHDPAGGGQPDGATASNGLGVAPGRRPLAG